jgi:hypothetical protein
MLGLLVSAALAIAPAAPVLSAAEPVVPCFDGYVCAQLSKGTIIAVPEGQSYAFPDSTEIAGITNQTTVGYCVGGNPNFGLAAGVEVVRTQLITGFEPGRVCLT